MKTSLLITFAGSDRPGIVDALSRAVAEHGGNWERGRMARLAGRFAGILEVTVDEAQASPLAERLGRLRDLKVTVEREAAQPAPSGRLLRLGLTGQDREGIVREIAGALARRGVNIEELATETESAPMSGERLFRAHAELRCPVELNLPELRRALESISNELLVDLELEEVRP